MKLKIDSLDTEEFGRLNDYISSPSNITRKDSAAADLKVVIEKIEKAGLGADTQQEYEGVHIRVEDLALTKKELYALMDIVYTYSDSE